METNLIGKKITSMSYISDDIRKISGVVIAAIDSKYKDTTLATVDLFIEVAEDENRCSIRRVPIHQIIQIHKD